MRNEKRGCGQTSAVPVRLGNGRGTRQFRRRVIANITAANVKGAIRDFVDQQARIVTDDNRAYIGIGIGKEFAGGHETVTHSTGEYVRGDIHTNTAESSIALVKRGIMGIYHNISREYLHGYLWQWDFCWNLRESTMGSGQLQRSSRRKGNG